GIAGMDKKQFTLYNIISSILWAFSLIFAGHYLNGLVGRLFGVELKDNIGLIIVTIVLITTIPVIVKLVRKPTASHYKLFYIAKKLRRVSTITAKIIPLAINSFFSQSKRKNTARFGTVPRVISIPAFPCFLRI